MTKTIEVIKFSKRNGEDYYCLAEGMTHEKVGELARKNDVYEIRTMDMTEKEYHEIGATNRSAEFFEGIA